MTPTANTPMTFPEIERRLRLAAPDEPAVLPPLRLPAAPATRVIAGTVLRGRGEPATGLRLAFAIAALLLALLASILASGALRQRDEAPQLADCLFPGPDQVDAWIDAGCLPMTVPDGWTMLAAGQVHPGDFTDAGIAYEVIQLVMASAPLGGCPSPGGPFPTAFPIGTNAYEVPAATPDPGLWCLRAARLPDDGVRIEAARGTRISGMDPLGFGIPDTAEPTVEAGWTEVVAGRPARLAVTTAADGAGRMVETRTWDVIIPGSIDQVLRVRADIAGPNLDRGREAALAALASVRFHDPIVPLDEAKAGDVLRSIIDDLDRSARQSRSDLYGCFPREPGSRTAVITGGPTGPLARTLDVTCTTEMSASLAGVWRIVLDVAWEPTDGAPGDTVRTELFTTGVVPDGLAPGAGFPTTGGYVRSLEGRSMPVEGINGWFPGAGYEPPPPLAGPLDLPVGSLVEMLWPGEEPASEPGQGSDALAPPNIGVRLSVVEGPLVVDGEEWYRVQWDRGSLWSDFVWVRGTRDGRPQLREVAPACPATPLEPGNVAWLAAAERVACFGGGDIVLPAVVFERSDGTPLVGECLDVDGPCPTGAGQPDWLAAPTFWVLRGADGSTVDQPLAAWLGPSVAGPSPGAAVRVVGHFDDPRAEGCRLGPLGSSGVPPEAQAFAELLCRQRFVVTSIEPAT